MPTANQLARCRVKREIKEDSNSPSSHKKRHGNAMQSFVAKVEEAQGANNAKAVLGTEQRYVLGNTVCALGKPRARNLTRQAFKNKQQQPCSSDTQNGSTVCTRANSGDAKRGYMPQQARAARFVVRCDCPPPQKKNTHTHTYVCLENHSTHLVCVETNTKPYTCCWPCNGEHHIVQGLVHRNRQRNIPGVADTYAQIENFCKFCK